MNNLNKIIIAYVSFPKVDLARLVAKKLVLDKLAACVKVLDNNMESYYIFEEKLTIDNEVYLMIKTQEDKIKDIKVVLDEMHPYKVYEFIYVEAKAANDKYFEWIDSTLNKKI